MQISVSDALLGQSRPALGSLGALKQVCIVTKDLNRTVAGMLASGIGPWKVYTFGPDTCTDLTYHGAPSQHSMRIGLADIGGLQWEVVQPLDGDSIYSDFLAKGGDGVQHLQFDLGGIDWESKQAFLTAAGYKCIQSGKWVGRLRYAYYSREALEMGTIVEIVDIPSGWSRPVEEEYYE